MRREQTPRNAALEQLIRRSDDGVDGREYEIEHNGSKTGSQKDSHKGSVRANAGNEFQGETFDSNERLQFGSQLVEVALRELYRSSTAPMRWLSIESLALNGSHVLSPEVRLSDERTCCSTDSNFEILLEVRNSGQRVDLI